MKNRRVVVTGYGALSPLGLGGQATWSAIMEKHLGYQIHCFNNPQINARYFGFMTEDKECYRFIPKSISRVLPIFAKNAVAAAHQALKMAFGEVTTLFDTYEPKECGAIIGTAWGGVDQGFEMRDAFRDTGFGPPLGTLITMPSIATAACMMLWGFRGYQNTISAACATGAIAIGDAFEAIKQGRASMMLAGGSESIKSITNIWSIDKLNALSKEQEDVMKACCPFDRRRSGFVMSEGAAVLCLEELEHAQHRGAFILGEITGYGNFSDASDFTAPAADMAARVNSIQFALAQAGKSADSISYINAHGTSTPLNDVNESNAIKIALGEAAYDVPISSTKVYSGHLIAAAGSFESIVCLKAIETNIIPGMVNLLERDPECDLSFIGPDHLFDQQVDVTLNLSFGFGGANCALVIERYR